jgi:hypothetical protein
MPRSTAPIRLAALALLCLPLSLIAGEEPPPDPARAQAPATGPSPPPWHRLHFAADSLAGSVTTTLTLSPAKMADVEARTFPESGDTPEAFTASRVLQLQVDGEARTVLTGSTTRASVWFDADSSQVLLRERTSAGSKGSSKIHRFGARGASRLRLEPADSRQALLPSAQWSKRSGKFFPYDMARAGCNSITVPAQLIYAISRQPELTPYCVFHDGALYRVQLQSRGNEKHAVSYSLRSTGGQRQVSGPRRLERIALRIEPLDPKARLEDFELLELRGDITIQVDPEYRIPVMLSGSRSGLGSIIIRLTDASLEHD